MKRLLRVLSGLCLSACIASASAGLSAVSFVVKKQQFKAGDAIVIDQVLASSPNLGIGDKVVVHGHYRLASAPKASLGLFVTHPSPDGVDRISPSQKARIEGANGSFELSCEITYIGNIHVSFYPASGGESFGDIYFATSAR
jgi:hypothetical protein